MGENTETGMTINARTGRRRWAVAAAAALPITAALLIGAPAQAEPADPAEPDTTVVEPDDDDQVKPGAPMPVRNGAFGYLATRGATLWLAGQKPAQAIGGLPVPPQYHAANRALADQMDRELTAAARTPGACVQIIVDTQAGGGNLFDYGIWSVEREYCPGS